jgi:type II secretory pathway pseudopilin PulG
LVLDVTARYRGFSLLELLGVIAIGTLAAEAIVTTLMRQQQFYRAATELRSARAEVRDAVEVLSSDIRGMSAGDTRLRADSALELFAEIGVSIVCQVAGNEVGLPPSHVSGNTLTSILTDPDTGDIATFYVDSAGTGARWMQYRLAGFELRNLDSTCGTSGFSSATDRGVLQKGFALTISGAIPSGIGAGTPVRFLRRARYSLYRASDGKSYLGYRRCNALGPSVCGTIQPLSGPYLRYSTDEHATGLRFEYFDDSGAHLDPTAPATALARIDISARSASGQRNPFSRRGANISDSGTVSVALRNRGGD